jgi:hypothetical protein
VICPLTLRKVQWERDTRDLSVAEESMTHPVECFIDASIALQIRALEERGCMFCKGRGRNWDHACRLFSKDKGRVHVKCPSLMKHTCLKCMLRGDHFYGECVAPFWGATVKGWSRFCSFLGRKFSLRAIVQRRTRTDRPPCYNKPVVMVRANGRPIRPHAPSPLPSIPEEDCTPPLSDPMTRVVPALYPEVPEKPVYV